uniref:Reverse transcriptase zinc-binding domain-containing protein n=1 Tax=Quercus lobata TaxID=97700 RepID=A0A7N2N060_QUELO
MEASVHPRSSFAWRSILQARDVISQGTVWRDLFFEDRRVWDPGLVESLFLTWEAETILRIPISEGHVKDQLIWPLTPDGNFSVRSAYRMLESTACFLNPRSSMDGVSKVWKGMWKIKTPNKIRHFLWRAARDSLPTKQNLCQRHVLVDASCPLCDEHTESLMHCLWLCDHAKAVWKSDICFPGASVRENQPTWQLKEIGDSARALVQEFFEACQSDSGPIVPTVPVRWSRPPEGIYR